MSSNEALESNENSSISNNQSKQHLTNNILQKLKVIKQLKLGLEVNNQKIDKESLSNLLRSTIQRDGDLYNLTINIPLSGVRRPISFVCVIDVSGSMGLKQEQLKDRNFSHV